MGALLTQAPPRAGQDGDLQRLEFDRQVAAAFARMVRGSFSWDPPNVPAASTVDTTITTVAGADLGLVTAGMWVVVVPPFTMTAGLLAQALAPTVAGQLVVRLGNVTAGGLDAPAGTWRFFGVT